MRRIFVPPDAIKEDTIYVTGSDVNHIKDVLRMREKDIITATCGRGTNYICSILKINKEEIVLHIDLKEDDISELPVKISLYQALPKGDKLELVIQKAVELGVSEVIPVRTARCVVKVEGVRADKKLERWKKLSMEAAKQSGRGMVPDVLPVMDFNEAIKRARKSEYMVIPYELYEEGGLRSLKNKIAEGVESISVFIGPEGGFERDEVKKAVSEGGNVISLGRRILRTETAAIAVLAHIMMLIEEK